tara:strand:+ start:1505 stop:2326 length:822 start_codon:yes stop_codon:yes gene_type:complete
MILHHKEIPESIQLGIKKSFKYSEDFTFVPLLIQKEDKYIPCIFQTPDLFIPYGKQTLQNGKQILDLSFQNKENDKELVRFEDNLRSIHRIVQRKYKNTMVNSFLKETNYDNCIRLKVNSNSQFYNQCKQKIHQVQPFRYGIFIIHLEGLWINQGKLWFQWELLQGKIEQGPTIQGYSFNEEKSKYDKMIQMGVPIAAVEIRKQMDSKIPPPPPLPSLNTSTPSSKIKASDLQRVVLKKAKPLPKRKPQKGEFEPPSLEELQITISKLKKSKA